jgi:hypothetical protein
MAYGALASPAGAPAVPSRHSHGMHARLAAAAVALLVSVVVGSVVIVSTQAAAPEPVDLASAPMASDFFASALDGLESQRFGRTRRGATGAVGRGHREVSLHEDNHGDVNLNVDIERNGKLVGKDSGLKVPVGRTTHLKLALPRKGRLQQLDEDVPVMPAFSDEDGVGVDSADHDDDDEEEPEDDDDTSELGTAKRQVNDAKQRVLEDARRLDDIQSAIEEESDKATKAQDYKAEAIEGEAAAKRRAIEEVAEEKEALRKAKERADTLAVSKEAEAMKAKMEAAEAKSAAKTAEARAKAAEQASELELEKKKEAIAADAEQEAWDKYQSAETEKAEALRQARQITSEEKEVAAKDGAEKKKQGAVNMNIKVNVDSPVGGDYSNWEERCAMEPELAGCSPKELAEKKEEEKRQVNMNIVVNVRSPTDTADPSAMGERDTFHDGSRAPAQEAGEALPGQQELHRVAMPMPP